MEISSVNSLAEVGLGINLAYSLVQGLRESLFSEFEKNLKTSTDKIQANLNEVVRNNIASSIAVKTDDIKQCYSNSAAWLNKSAIVLALIAALY